MFGNTGFGASKPAGTGFGAFGATNTANPSMGLGMGTAFNKPATTFGSPQGGTGFGAPAAGAGGFGGAGAGGFGSTNTGGFGQQAGGSTFGGGGGAANTGFGAKSAFGTSSTVTSNLAGLGGGGLGGGGGGWGSPTPTAGGLGGGMGGAGGFGQGTTSAFGQPAAGSSPFGARANTLGAPATGAFGAPAGGGFGGGATGGFGATAAPATGFGAGATNTGFGGGGFGGGQTTGAFGATNTGTGFGAPAGGGAFGGTSAFGAGATGGLGGGFGQPQQQQSGSTTFGGFGGAPAATGGAFGAAPAASTGFGGLGGAFGGAQQQQQQQGGTGNPPFKPLTVNENIMKDGHQRSTVCNIQAITAMPAYQHKSVEELRYEDYARGNKGGSTTGGMGGGLGTGFGGLGGGAAAGGGMFGGGLNTPASTGFGAAATTAPSGFGASAFGGNTGTTGAFGAPATGAFGAPAAAGSFGAPATTGAFGAPAGGGFGAPAAGAFGAPATTGAFGAPAAGGFGAPAAGGFGSTTGTGAFGAPATGAFGAPATGGFGSTSTTTGTGGFGGAAAPAFGAPATTSGFGGGAFGAPAAAPAFGGGGFGAPAGNSSTTSGFGGGGFGQPQTGGTTTGGFGSTAAAPAFGGFGQAAQKPATTGGFGGFGSTAPAAGGFGAPATGGFGAPAGGGGFGAPAGGGGFGAGGFGAPASTTPAAGGGFGGFGAKPATTTTPSFGGFGAPASTGGFGAPAGGGFGSTAAPASGGFGTGGFGAPAAGGTTSFSSSLGGFGQPVQTQAPTQVAGMSNQQLQQQLLLQVASLQQQQQEQDIASRIEMLRRKKEEFSVNSKDDKALVALTEQQKPAPNLFSGFVGTKTQPAAYYRSSPRSTARILPRGVRPLASPTPTPSSIRLALTATSHSESSSARLAHDTPDTPYHGDNLLSPEPFSISRSAKKLIIPSYKSTTAMLDPTEDLPPVPGSAQRGRDSTGSNMQQTPYRPDMTGASTGNSASSSSRVGEATGLTPAHTNTPYYARRHDGSSSNVDRNTDSSRVDQQADNANSFSSPVSFRLSPKDPTSTTTTRTQHSSTKFRTVSPIPHRNQTTEKVTVEDEDFTPPVLTMPGYYTCPDIAILQKFSSKELSKVKNFTIFRPNVGKIEWIGETDIRNLNLDDIVKIENKEVFVYEEVTPVPEGTELNKPAIVTLCNIFPKENISEKKKSEFYHKLQDFCELNDADFVSYDRNTGDWVFTVKHFSRYGLDDSDDEDAIEEREVEMECVEESDGVKSVTMENMATTTGSTLASHNIQRLRQMLLKSKQNTFTTTTTGSSLLLSAEKRSSDQLAATAVVEEEEGSDSPPWKRRTEEQHHSVHQQQEQSAFSLSSVAPLTIAAAAPRHEFVTMEALEQALKPRRAQAAVEKIPAFHLPQDSPCMRIMMEVKAKAAAATGSTVDRSAAAYTQPGMTSTTTTTSVSSLQKGMKNYALSMGRSFRVGWSKDGKIAHAGMFTFKTPTVTPAPSGETHRIAIEKVDVFRWVKSLQIPGEMTSSPESLCEVPLDAMLSSSTHMPMQSNQLSDTEIAASQRADISYLSKLPLWKLPNADPSELHEYIPFLTMLKSTIGAYSTFASDCKHPDWLVGKAIELIDATYGQETTSFSADPEVRAVEMLPLYEDRQQYLPEVWERRRSMLSNWIERVTATEIQAVDAADNGQYGQDPKTYNRLFELLSCKRINDAVTLAEKAGMFRLATLLSQVDGDATVPLLVRNQLEMWRVTEADLTMAPELVKLYRLLAGTVVTETREGETELDLVGLGWLRGIGVLFWYCSSSDSFIHNISTLSSAVDSYRIVLQDAYADPPVSPYLQDRDPQGTDVSYPTVTNGLYSLLELLFPSANSSTSMDESDLELDIRNNVMKALRPSGYTRDALDYRASFLLLVLLECGGISEIHATHAHIIRQHYIFQLLSVGMWRWALFIALQLPDISMRYTIVTDIVLRYAGEYDWDRHTTSNSTTTTAYSRTAISSLHNFLTTALHLPECLLHEAQAYYTGLQHDYNKQVGCFISAGKYQNAIETTVREIAPLSLLASDSAELQLLRLLQTIENIQDQTNHRQYKSAYANHYNDLNQIFLSFLLLKENIMNIKNMKKTTENEAFLALMEVPDILRESRALIGRISALHQQRKMSNNKKFSSSRSGSVISSNDDLITVVLYNMCTYLYNIVQKLDLTTTTTSDGEQGAVTVHNILSLLSPDIMQEAPIFREQLATTANYCNTNCLHQAAKQLIII